MSNTLTSCVRLRLETSKKGKTTIYARIYKKFTWANLAIADLDRELWDAENKWPVLDDRTERVRARLIAIRALAADLLKHYIDQNLLNGPTYKTDLLEKIGNWESQVGNLTASELTSYDPLEASVRQSLIEGQHQAPPLGWQTKIQDLILAYQSVIKPNLAKDRKSHYRTLSKYLSDFEVFLNRNEQEQQPTGLSTQGVNLLRGKGAESTCWTNSFTPIWSSSFVCRKNVKERVWATPRSHGTFPCFGRSFGISKENQSTRSSARIFFSRTYSNLKTSTRTPPMKRSMLSPRLTSNNWC